MTKGRTFQEISIFKNLKKGIKKELKKAILWKNLNFLILESREMFLSAQKTMLDII